MRTASMNINFRGSDKISKTDVLPDTLRMVAWEVTRRCNLACVHCRASSLCGSYAGELTTDEGKRLLDDIASCGNPVIILTGGEPLLRPDIYELAAYGNARGLRMVLATNATLLSEPIAREMLESGIKRVSVSIDGLDAVAHDSFRGVAGAFDGAMAGIAALKRAGMEFQINTTITQANLAQIEGILNLALRLGAAAHHIFLLVPTGRGKDLADQEISPQDYERTLEWFHDKSLTCPIQLKATCAPHYHRIFHQRKSRARVSQPPKTSGHSFQAMTRGCMGGSSFCFVSHTGQVQPCGYLEIDCGQLRSEKFPDIWKNSDIFKNLRDLSRLRGKCGRCEFIRVCGGCRARAFEITGDYLDEEPFCIYEPRREAQSEFGAR
jgi:heme b synthase